MSSITSVTPTICRLMGIEPPSLSSTEYTCAVIENAEFMGIDQVRRLFFYAPDAIGSSFIGSHTQLFRRIIMRAPLRVPLTAVMPSVTPVCFASMLTGALPSRHGIMKYEKPVLAVETLFDTLAQAGRKTAIVAVRDSSLALIFRNRKIDYFIEKYDEEVNSRALRLIEQGSHDFIIAYNQEYDDALHRTTPHSPEAVEAVKHHVTAFEDSCCAMEHYWKDCTYAFLFAPDHGAHVDSQTGRGTHGDTIPDDMEVTHFWGFVPLTGHKGAQVPPSYP
jgi:predicted AlkP superfamily pyrophosphatase or phosphodiesterase